MNQSLEKVLNAATDKPIFFAYQNNVKLPPEPYLTIHVISTNTSKPPHRSQLDADDKRMIESHRQSLVQIDCYGKDGYELLDKMAQALQSEASLSLCESLNVSISDYKGIKRLPIKVDDIKYQNRSILTIAFNYVTGIEEQLPAANKVII